MASCNDCIHNEICQKFGGPFNISDADTSCTNFKSRSRFVELPCKVGDTVYFNNAHFRYAKVMAIYIDASGGMFDLKIFTNIETVAGYEHFINKDYTFEDIGKRLFLTKEAAEPALKEREENAN